MTGCFEQAGRHFDTGLTAENTRQEVRLRARFQLLGLRDKRYWRPDRLGLWHCLKRCDSPRCFVSLCLRVTASRCGGQGSHRPPAALRCPRCDIEEMKRVGADESLPERPDWRDTR